MSRKATFHVLICMGFVLPMLPQMNSFGLAQESITPIYTGSPLQLATEARIRQELDEPTTLEFIDTPLEDVLNYLENYHDFEIVIDQQALDNLGVDPGTPVTRSLSDLSLRSALSLILSDLDLTYLIEDEVLLITSMDVARTHLRTVVYPVVDLIAASDDPQQQGKELLVILESLVNPCESSEPNGAFALLGNHLIVQQPLAAQEEIQRTLDALRRANY